MLKFPKGREVRRFGPMVISALGGLKKELDAPSPGVNTGKLKSDLERLNDSAAMYRRARFVPLVDSPVRQQLLARRNRGRASGPQRS